MGPLGICNTIPRVRGVASSPPGSKGVKFGLFVLAKSFLNANLLDSVRVGEIKGLARVRRLEAVVAVRYWQAIPSDDESGKGRCLDATSPVALLTAQEKRP